jgi:Acyl-coenzyme A:6-aminopenicillanic acid acyl-transferase
MSPTSRGLSAFPAIALVLTVAAASAEPITRAGGSRQRLNGYLVLELRGTPEQMGRQHGLLLKAHVQRMIHDLLLEGEASTRKEHARLVAGAMVMERYLEPEFRRELKALALAAEVDYRDLVLAQLFGDVQRASQRSYSYTPITPSRPRPPGPESPWQTGPDYPWPRSTGMECTSYAVFGPATRTGECIVGRNMDFWDHGVSTWGGVLIHFRPTRGIPFVTTSWAGIINGWTAMNVEGIVCANNSSFSGRSNSLEGLSTCFMVRKVAQYAHTVEEGVEIVRKTPRACGTNLIIAGGSPPNAAIVEYDHEGVAVRWAERGAVWADNSFNKLYQEESSTGYSYFGSRYDRLKELITDNFGRIDRSMNFAAAEGVPIRSINLHSALLFPRDLRFNVSMTQKPAADHWYRPFRLTAEGIERVSLAEAYAETHADP